MATNSRKRQMWLQACGVFTLIWFVLGIIIWPLLFLALCSALMALIPVGVSDTEVATRKPGQIPDAEAWRQRGDHSK